MEVKFMLIQLGLAAGYACSAAVYFTFQRT